MYIIPINLLLFYKLEIGQKRSLKKQLSNKNNTSKRMVNYEFINV